MQSASFLAVFLAALPCLSLPDEPDNPSQWITSPGQWSQLREGKVILLSSDATSSDDSGYSATAAVVVDAPPSEVWKVVDDGNAAAGFQDSLVSSKVIERAADYTLVEQVVKIGLTKVNYVVRQKPQPPRLMDFELESGDLREMDGFWRCLPLESEGKQRTLLIYRLSLKPAIPIPGFLIRKSIAKNLPATLSSVRDETLRRARSS